MIRSPFDHSDKVGHFAVYGLYAALLLWALPSRQATQRRWYALTVVFCGVFGIAMEVLQATLSAGMRTGSAGDAAANLAGAACMALLIARRPRLFARLESESLEMD